MRVLAGRITAGPASAEILARERENFNISGSIPESRHAKTLADNLTLGSKTVLQGSFAKLLVGEWEAICNGVAKTGNPRMMFGEDTLWPGLVCAHQSCNAAPTVVHLDRSANTRVHQHVMARARVIPGANAKEKVRADTANAANAAKRESAATTTAPKTAGAAASRNNDVATTFADAAN